ncbi:MAG: glucose 1-dehydrogenase [bacterium]|nr:glucose 1-dehydrogenase [bacterium]
MGDHKLDLFNLQGKVAVVSGAGGGIGGAIAQALAGYGAIVMIVDRDPAGARSKADLITGMGARALPYGLDITDFAAIEKMTEAAVAEFGRIDILVNSAGMNIRKAVVDIHQEDWDPVIDVNLKGAVFCCQAAARVMIKQNRGKIINIASISSILGHPDRAAYAASKGGLIQVTKVMATEWARYNICVNAISPAAVDTPFIDGLKKNRERLDREKARIPLGRIAIPEDIMGAAVFLASDASDFITGHNLIIDGGRIVD